MVNSDYPENLLEAVANDLKLEVEAEENAADGVVIEAEVPEVVTLPPARPKAKGKAKRKASATDDEDPGRQRRQADVQELTTQESKLESSQSQHTERYDRRTLANNENRQPTPHQEKEDQNGRAKRYKTRNSRSKESRRLGRTSSDTPAAGRRKWRPQRTRT